ncbi:MAG: hypothetical protein B7Y47_14160 [Sphingomonas sp. 28-63-12]|nr:MAG: hypothetical protein B7Y47_14160 [Sphingomonas sp. 28-63-12]
MAYMLAGNAVAAAPGVASGGRWFTTENMPEWIQVLLALAGLFVGGRIVFAIIGVRDRLPALNNGDPVEFVTMLCDQVWDCTNRITTIFAQRLRQPPSDIAAMRILVRHLREDLSIPMNFIEQMRAHPPGNWHGTTIFMAFTNWSAQIAAMTQQLDDLHQAITYPLLREPVDKQRDAMLVYQYHIEQAFLDRRVDEVVARAYEFCEVARKVLKKKKEQTNGGQSDHQDHDCPCCKRRPENHRHSTRDPLQAIVLPPAPVTSPPPAPPPSAPAPIICCCVPLRACQCRRGCACACQCTPVAAQNG